MKSTRYFAAVAALAGAMFVSGCTAVDFGMYEKGDAYGDYDGPSGEYAEFSDGGSSEDGQGIQGQAGVLTAGEWSDLDNWDFWCGLMNGQVYDQHPAYWGFYPENRVAVKLTDESNNPVVGAKIALVRETTDGEATIWKTISDNHGLADCWVGMFQKQDSVSTEGLFVKVNGVKMDTAAIVATIRDKQLPVNTYTVAQTATVSTKVQIAFIVDATGSMSDEINFLKSDLQSIIGKVGQDISKPISTGALFYRDEGDDYLTRASNFSDDLSVTSKFINEQIADGGGDYPEAVHTALENALQSLSWDENAYSRIAFLILDAPGHHNNDVISSFQQSINIFAQSGIKIVPVAASGVDKNTEFMCRSFAMATGGTYVFLTNDSGVGGDHIEASVGEHDVELLNELIVRLIKFYAE